jgi:hypothetical protein
MDELIYEGYDFLVEAIVLRAISDYKTALRYKDREAKSEYMKYKVSEARIMYYDVRRFFHSDYYKELCKIDGDKILNHIENEVANNKRRRLKQFYRKPV